MTINFSIHEQSISLVRPQSRMNIVANSQNYLRAGFTFSEEWVGVITAVFEHPTLGARAALVGSDGSCLVPWEVIQPPYFWVGAFCSARVTSNRAQVFVQESVSLTSEATAAPTPTIYEQIIALLESIGGATGVAVERDPTVPAHVKGITAEDIARWNADVNVDLTNYLTKAEAQADYQPAGDYATETALANMLSKVEAASTYQPAGEYLTSNDLDAYLPREEALNTYQPAGEYLTSNDLEAYLPKSEAEANYQPAGTYVVPGDLTPLLSKSEAESTYQPKGQYMESSDTIDISRLRDSAEDNAFGLETAGLAVNSVNRLFYYKSDAITNINNIYHTGAYGVRNTDTNMPYLGWWYVLIFCKNEEMQICVQWAFAVRPENNGELWIRVCRGQEQYYGAWKRVALDDQITALEARVAALEANRT